MVSFCVKFSGGPMVIIFPVFSIGCFNTLLNIVFYATHFRIRSSQAGMPAVNNPNIRLCSGCSVMARSGTSKLLVPCTQNFTIQNPKSSLQRLREVDWHVLQVLITIYQKLPRSALDRCLLSSFPTLGNASIKLLWGLPWWHSD